MGGERPAEAADNEAAGPGPVRHPGGDAGQDDTLAPPDVQGTDTDPLKPEGRLAGAGKGDRLLQDRALEIKGQLNRHGVGAQAPHEVFDARLEVNPKRD